MDDRKLTRVRLSLADLQAEYEKGNKKPLEDLMRAWRGIKALGPEDKRSFFYLAGLHGEPFRGGGWGNSAYWGGYCNHGNVLFPTWHRIYVYKIEEALRSIPGCADVTLPYWDETSEESVSHGIPWALTIENFELDGEMIPNPLRSFVFPVGIVDKLSPLPDADYSKPAGYETVRYPLSGLVSTSDKAATDAHNMQFPDYEQNIKFLNANVVDWLGSSIVVNGKRMATGVHHRYVTCLDAPNYTVFSNTTSQQQWNVDNPNSMAVVPLESPHNAIHLAVGGFSLPKIMDVDMIEGANGDMGENDTASFDPIFFFHHCFVDRVFWLWQKRHGATDHLEIIPEYPGTNTADNQGPTPGFAPNVWLDLDSPLKPFKKEDGSDYTSRDCVNIETQMGYSYGTGSLEDLPAPSKALADSGMVIRAGGVNRGAVRGSFLISAYMTVDGKKFHIGSDAILSRWHVQGCANCQTHMEVKSFFNMHHLVEAKFENATFEVRMHMHRPRSSDPNSILPTSSPVHFDILGVSADGQ